MKASLNNLADLTDATEENLIFQTDDQHQTKKLTQSLKNTPCVDQKKILLEKNIKIFKILEKEYLECNGKNINSFLFSCFCYYNPIFVEEIIQKSSKNRINYQLSYSFLNRFVNKCMSKSNKNSGKKNKIAKRILKILEDSEKKYDLPKVGLLLLLLVKTVPDHLVRNLKYGAGFLTKKVKLTVGKKITWFLQQWGSLFKKRKKSLEDTFKQQISAIMSDNISKSKLLTAKRDADAQSLKANID